MSPEHCFIYFIFYNFRRRTGWRHWECEWLRGEKWILKLSQGSHLCVRRGGKSDCPTEQFGQHCLRQACLVYALDAESGSEASPPLTPAPWLLASINLMGLRSFTYKVMKCSHWSVGPVQALTNNKWARSKRWEWKGKGVRRWGTEGLKGWRSGGWGSGRVGCAGEV